MNPPPSLTFQVQVPAFSDLGGIARPGLNSFKVLHDRSQAVFRRGLREKEEAAGGSESGWDSDARKKKSEFLQRVSVTI
jgi:hypothetical protein